jgi:hypothetical protein
LDIPGLHVSVLDERVMLCAAKTYSSVSGAIFFSSFSSSAKLFWCFSQFAPVADGMVADGECVGERDAQIRPNGVVSSGGKRRDRWYRS